MADPYALTPTVRVRQSYLRGFSDYPECQEAKNAYEAFERLSQKPDKKAATRASAAQQAADWKRRYDTCVTEQAAKAAVSQVATQQQIIGQATGTLIPTGTASAPTSKWLVYGGIALAAGLGLMLVMRLRKR